MRLHARAVILLGGWLLMFPPCRESVRDANRLKVKCNVAASLAEWKVGATFKTKEGCNAAIEGAKNPDGCWEPETQGMSPEEKTKALSDARIEVQQWMSSRCVPAESLYPPQPPAQK